MVVTYCVFPWLDVVGEARVLWSSHNAEAHGKCGVVCGVHHEGSSSFLGQLKPAFTLALVIVTQLFI